MSSPSTPLRAATLNIWNRLGPWDERFVAITRALRALDPDVIGLQEVLRPTPGGELASSGLDQAVAIAEGRYHVAYGSARFSPMMELGNAILSRWPIARQEVFALPHLETDERRCLVFAEIDAPFGKLPFFVTHLNWKLHEGSVRQAQVREIVSHIKRLAPVEGFPPVLVGDFNAEPESDEIRFMKGLTALGGATVYFADGFGVAGDGSRGITFARRNPFAAVNHEPDRRIDYVFVRGPDDRYRGEVLSTRVCFDEAIDGVFPSDHFGVVAEIST